MVMSEHRRKPYLDPRLRGDDELAAAFSLDSALMND